MGSFDLILPSGMKLIGCSLVHGEHGMFIGLPTRSWVKDGATKYIATVEIPDKDKRKKFNDSVLVALSEAGAL